MRNRELVLIAALLLAPRLLPGVAVQQRGTLPHVVVHTELGDIEIEVDTARAPGTAANFLKYVDARHFDAGTWHRTVKMDNQPDNQIKIEVIQAAVNPDKVKDGFPPIPLERTNTTGILHKDGTVSMARGRPTARRPASSSASTTSRPSTSGACGMPTARDSPHSVTWYAAWTSSEESSRLRTPTRRG